MITDITFSVNRYDSDGGIVERGVFLHFGDTSVKVCSEIREIGLVGEEFRKIAKEIAENYRD